MSRTLCLFFCLLFLAGFSGCDEQPRKAMRKEYPVYTSLRSIPGVSEEEIAAVEKLRAAQRSFILGMNRNIEAFVDDDGRIGGYSALLCDWLSTLFKMPFTVALYEWEDLVAGLDSRVIDLTGEMTATEERRARYFMTDAIAERAVKCMRIKGSEDLSRIRHERPLRYGFLEGTITYSQVAPYVQADSSCVFVGNYTDAYRTIRIPSSTRIILTPLTPWNGGTWIC